MANTNGYRVLRGKLAIEGKSPDGDTISFYLDPEQQDAWVWKNEQSGRFPKFNGKYQTNVRLEAIDALELHYTVEDVYPQVTSHQNLSLAITARDRMLTLCGFETKNLKEDAKHILSDPDEQLIPAVVAYKDIDPFGRLIGFVFHVEDAPELSTEKKPKVFLEPTTLLKSVNARLLRDGFVFPTYYGGLCPELRRALTEDSAIARGEKLGVWKGYQDRIVLPRKPTIAQIESAILLPKVYRRLISHIARNGSMSTLYSYLEGEGDQVVDTVDVRVSNHLGAFLKATEVTGSPRESKEYELRLTRSPEELIFLAE